MSFTKHLYLLTYYFTHTHTHTHTSTVNHNPEILVFLERYAACIGSYRRFGTDSLFQNTGSYEPTTPRNISEERKYHLNRGEM